MTSRVHAFFMELSTLQKKVTSTIRLPLELTAAISSKAKLQGTSMQAIVERYLEAWVTGATAAQNTPYVIPPPRVTTDLHDDQELITSMASITKHSPGTAAALRTLITTLSREANHATYSDSPTGAAGAAFAALAQHDAALRSSGATLPGSDHRSHGAPKVDSADKASKPVIANKRSAR